MSHFKCESMDTNYLILQISTSYDMIYDVLYNIVWSSFSCATVTNPDNQQGQEGNAETVCLVHFSSSFIILPQMVIL